MDATAIIALAIAAMNEAIKAIDAANTGDLATAQAHLAAARNHFSASVDAWDKA